MSPVHRLLPGAFKRSSKSSDLVADGGLGAVFTLEGPQKKKADKEEEKRIKAFKARLENAGWNAVSLANVEYAFRGPAATGEEGDAIKTCSVLQHTHEGLLEPFNPDTKLLGAVNREGVTCYLDALLFAMFARLDGFEAMVYQTLEDAPRKRLAGLLRLWVNCLRTGRLIEKDLTKHVQQALADCGWAAANKLEQQDTSEAFGFITGQLELPLLTLKMDLFHTGKEDVNDDHKFVNERLLEVAILDKPSDDKPDVTLEDCLEHYFNNRIEVKRHLEQQRRASAKHVEASEVEMKAQSLHIETAEIDSEVETPITEVPKKSLIQQLRPSMARNRADSIFSQRRVSPDHDAQKSVKDTAHVPGDQSKPEKGSLRTEVLMPAWQFFKLLPWYADSMPTSDAQVAAHFASKRPTLGICLKRYFVSNSGVCERLDTYVDIPLEIAVPEFVSHDSMEEGSPLVGNFKLVLQSVVCHRGKSLHSGHYIALVRGHAANAVRSDSAPRSPSPSDTDADTWMLFDDMAAERVKYVDIDKALKEESPYLLFYQVQPIDEDEPLRSGPPSYDEAMSFETTDRIELREKALLPEYGDGDVVLVEKSSPPIADTTASDATEGLSVKHFAPRSSFDAESRRGRRSGESDRRRSIAVTDGGERNSLNLASTGPSTPNEDGRFNFLGLPSRRGSRQHNGRKTKSRPTSLGPDSAGRFSLNMSRLANRKSRNEVPPLPSADGSSTQADPEMGPTDLEKVVSHSSPVLTSVDETDSASAVTTGSLEQRPWRKKDKHPAKDNDDAEKKKLKKKGEIPERDCRVM